MNKFLRLIAFFTLLLPTFLISAEEEEHVPVGTRPKYSDLVSFSEREIPLFVTETEEQTTCGFIFDRYPPIYYPPSYHSLRSVSAFGDSLELEDGSVWKLPSPDGKAALYWEANVPIAITQNTSWFSRKYKYRLIYNPQSQNPISIDANLHFGPYKNGEYTLYAADFNHPSKRMVLSDFSQWEIYSWDSSKFSEWQPNDVIIIGFNSCGFFDSNYEALLINVTTDDYIRARQY